MAGLLFPGRGAFPGRAIRSQQLLDPPAPERGRLPLPRVLAPLGHTAHLQKHFSQIVAILHLL
jgi:hypothetical protein